MTSSLKVTRRSHGLWPALWKSWSLLTVKGMRDEECGEGTVPVAHSPVSVQDGKCEIGEL